MPGLFRCVAVCGLLTMFITLTRGFCGESAGRGIWISAEEIAKLPTSGDAWQRLKAEADRSAGTPDVSNQDDPTNVCVLAKALVYARTQESKYRDEVVKACMAAIGTEKGGRTLALARELAAYVIAADLVGLPDTDDQRFRDWLREVLTETLDGRTLQSTHEDRPNNWGTHSGASRAAVAVYLGDQAELERTAKVFKGYLGDRSSYTGFEYGELSWQVDSSNPVGINPKGAMKDGHPIDGVLPDDQRRGGSFSWPPPKENYVYEGLQGALAQAVILYRAGYDVWNWEDQALLRAFRWLHEQANFTPSGDDAWQPPVVDYYYGTSFWKGAAASSGKNVGWTDWTHGEKRQLTGVEERNAEQGSMPSGFLLEQNFPNPFSAAIQQTVIPYQMNDASAVTLEIYNLMGQRVRTLFSGMAQPGRRGVAWDGRDAQGFVVPNGFYFYKLQSGGRVLSKRMILAR